MKHLFSKKNNFLIAFIFVFSLFFSFQSFALATNIDTGFNIENIDDTIPTQNQGTGFDFSGLNEVISNPISGSSGASGGNTGKYQPITPGGSSFFGGAGFEDMLEKIFQITIYFTVILSVIMIIYGGVEYMGSESVFKKGQGRERIWAALLGLFIALVSILIIATILPGYQGSAFRITIFN